ncbi:hypothetical protein EMPG_10126 [Blastomyces silverae]|uniref:Uncharacterized protein n=1 Tax=Blastomyces silverae TaxID=2060906 RepID=A0A0H1B4X6_9EURO|nr:hypothetical protein EMPG_10126 [Blastomyces silverae]
MAVASSITMKIVFYALAMMSLIFYALLISGCTANLPGIYLLQIKINSDYPVRVGDPFTFSNAIREKLARKAGRALPM